MRRRLGYAGAVAALGLLTLAGPAAAADRIGGLLVTPGESADTATIQLRTSAGCPAQADAYYATAKGHGFPAKGQVIAPNGDAGLSHDGPFVVHVAQTLRDFAADNNAELSGRYELSVLCIDSFSQRSYGEFTAELEFASPTRYEAIGKAKGPKRLPAPDAVDPAPAAGRSTKDTEGGKAEQPSTPPSSTPSDAQQGGDTADGGLSSQPILLVAGGAVAVAGLGFGFSMLRRRRPANTDVNGED